MMTYNETLDYLYQQLPMFQRVGAAAYKASLDNTHALCLMLGNPEQKLRCVHIAGTNGKGSVSHMTASVLQAAGYKTGLFTSPHMRDFRERIKINGEMISREAVISFVERYANDWQRLSPSFFEITFVMAMWYFEREKADVVVLETGMGGRLDSTNVVRPVATAITNVGFDHTQFLGETIPAIAGEKAGIIKTGVPVVAGMMLPEALSVIQLKASEKKAALHICANSATLDLPETDLKGPYQQENLVTALALLGVLKEKGFGIDEQSLLDGLKTVVAKTGLLGRWQQLSAAPLTIADCAHNYDGLKMALKEISGLGFHNLHFVLGFSADKDLKSLLGLFPKTANYFFTSANVPRAMAADDLKQLAAGHGLRGEAFSSVRKAYEAARLYADKKDIIYIGGSVFVVAEIV